ncbi:MAG: hypothetical protein K6G18_05735 [Treponema sp.]|nr:hypothetical protein [Treponema sp.]
MTLPVTLYAVKGKSYDKKLFDGLQEAFDWVEQDGDCMEAYLSLPPGIFSGQFYLDGWRRERGLSPIPVHIIGSGQGKTILRGDLYARKMIVYGTGEDGRLGTFRSYTLFVSGPRVSIEALTIENTAGLPEPQGHGKDAGQAVALYADASFLQCRKVTLRGFQDTLFLAPLPKEERIKGGFKGPRDGEKRLPSFQIYENCRIYGTVDFIFGGASALFKHCLIAVRGQEGCDENYIAAPSADAPDENKGFVFYRCLIEKDESFAPVSCRSFLARPWRPFACCAYIRCWLDSFIESRLWDNWGNRDNEKNCRFGTYRNSWAGRGKETPAFGYTLARKEVRDLLRYFKKRRKELLAEEKEQGGA